MKEISGRIFTGVNILYTLYTICNIFRIYTFSDIKIN